MKRVLLGGLLGIGTLTGCQPAIISATMRDSDTTAVDLQTRCEPSDMRDVAEMQKVMSKYDGWRLIYVSEYTTGNRFGTVGVLCFERPKK